MSDSAGNVARGARPDPAPAKKSSLARPGKSSVLLIFMQQVQRRLRREYEQSRSR
jgi:hypothetical protein